MRYTIAVPLLRQRPGSVDCGLLCVQMIDHFDGNQTEFEELQKELPVNVTGTFAPQLGLHFLQRGYHVNIVTRNPLLIDVADENADLKTLRATFEKRMTKVDDEKEREALNYFITFIDTGGKLRVKIPTAEEIITQISKGRPVLALLNNAPLYDHPLKRNDIRKTYHWVVVTGIDDANIYVNDPIDIPQGGKRLYPKELFFFALYVSAMGDIDNACLMEIEKKIVTAPVLRRLHRVFL